MFLEDRTQAVIPWPQQMEPGLLFKKKSYEPTTQELGPEAWLLSTSALGGLFALMCVSLGHIMQDSVYKHGNQGDTCFLALGASEHDL